MGGKRKVHVKNDLTVPKVEHHKDAHGILVVFPEVFPPAVTVVDFGFNATGNRTFDFAPFYGTRIDEITYACQRQIERFLAKQDSEVEASSVSGYARKGLGTFLPYLTLRAEALRRSLTLADINRDVIDGYLAHLADSGVGYASQKARYFQTKAVLQAMGRRALISVVPAGEKRTFPKNPFPHYQRRIKGETPLTRKERQAFTAAVKTAVMPLFQDDVVVTSELLSYALLIVALHTGRNTTPLLEIVPDCLHAHPKENFWFLVLWKRRGHKTSKVALRGDRPGEGVLESMPGVKLPVVRLIRRVIQLAELLRAEAPPQFANRVWLYRSRNKRDCGTVTALSNGVLLLSIRKLVADAGLVDANSQPLRINVSRLRKTFASRVFELLDGDLGSTAMALGNTPKVAGRNYMSPGEDAQRNWKFLGAALTQELLTRTIGATERTPAGGCSDPTNGQYAPKRDGRTCFDFLNCLRCRNYVVTGDDLYKLYSFYWRVLLERDRMDARLWDKHYAHIPRLIERDVIEAGLRKRVFKPADVEAARERARRDPHPFWRFDSLASLDEFRDSQQEAP